MRCAFSDLTGVCHFKYPGYRCIEEDCEIWNNFVVMEKECVYLDSQGCIKLNLLTCKGKDNCVYFREYFESPEEFLKSRRIAQAPAQEIK